MKNPLSGVNGAVNTSLKDQAGALEKFEEQHEWMNMFNKAEDMAPDVGSLKDFYVEPDLGPEKHGLDRIKQIRAEDKRYVDAWNYIKECKKLVDDTDKMDDLIADFAEQLFGRVVDGAFRNDFPLPLAMIAPAATIGSCFLGMPHTHPHPPSLTPPNPVPVPLIAAGPVLTGNPTVLIGLKPATTTGELGMAIGCCSFSPYFKIYTGSHKVSIGGKRAARMGDIVKYCQPGPKAAPGGKAPPEPPANFKEAITEQGKKKIDAIYEKGLKENLKSGVAEGKKLKAKYDTWKAAQNDADAKRATATENPDDEQAQLEASAAEDAAQDATAIALADAELTAAGMLSSAMDMARSALESLLGKDPGTPPPLGIILSGEPRVWIAGFPMPELSELKAGLKKLRTPKGDPSKEKKLDAKNPSKREPADPAKQKKKEETKKEQVKQEAKAPKKEGDPNAFAAEMAKNSEREKLKGARQRWHEQFHIEKGTIIREKGVPKTKEEEAALTRKATQRANERELTTAQGRRDRQIREAHAKKALEASTQRRGVPKDKLQREFEADQSQAKYDALKKPPSASTPFNKRMKMGDTADTVRKAQKARETAEKAQQAKDTASQAAKVVPK